LRGAKAAASGAWHAFIDCRATGLRAKRIRASRLPAREHESRTSRATETEAAP
jgi:hypothetical protein